MINGHTAPDWSFLQRFAIDGQPLRVEAHERGHIHDTFVSTWQCAGERRRFIHQRLNETVFRDIPAVMHNVERVTRHLREKAGGARELDGFVVPSLVPSRDGTSYLRSGGVPWRTYDYVEGTRSHDRCESAEQAFTAAHAFGWFQSQLEGLDAADLRETLPSFFDSEVRYEQFADAVARDPVGRVKQVPDEIRFARDREPMVHVIEEQLRRGAMPRRVVHGDTKLNNVLIDTKTGAARSIIDLDTCMPGYSLYDFGDLVRFTAATCAEDERDLSRAGVDLAYYRALVDGYLDSAHAFLTQDEVRLMPFAARLVTLTIGLRFLADHLNGDLYFKVAREGHNLDRARVQFAMVANMEQREAEMAVR